VFEPDVRLVGFAVLITLGTALLFGWAPALHAVRGDLRSTMNDSVNGSTSSPSGVRTLSWLVGAEFAMAAVLLVSAGLFVRAFDQVRRIDPGFHTSNVLTFSVGLPPASYRDNPARLAFWNRSLERMRALPGVESVGIVTCAPLSHCHNGNFFNVEGRRPLAEGESNPVVLMRSASEGYVEAMGIRLAAGRELRSTDGPANLSAMVNETFIRTFWPGITAEQALGRRLSFNGDVPEWFSVVGVTRDVKHYGLEVPMRPGVYFPQAVVTRSSMTFATRVKGDPNALMPSVRTAFRELDPSLAIFRVRSTDTMLAESLRSRRLYSWTIAVFAVLALILALGGAYGVTSYLTTQRRREIGIRMAIGAGQHDVVRAILVGAARTVLPGLAAGVIGAVLLAGLMDDLLFGVSPREPLVLAISTVILLAAAFAANWLPARRAAKTNPMNSLRA
jgi:putative ABC transport system permease protein